MTSGYNNYLTSASPVAAASPWGAAAPAQAPMQVPMQMSGAMPQMGGANPYLTPDMLYQQLGYYTQPTEVDIDADLLQNYNPMAAFLSEQQGLLIMAQLISTVVDHRLKSFFESYHINLMEAEDGSGMFLKPKLEQLTDEGTRLKGLTHTTVQAEINGLAEHLKTSFVEPGKAVISAHKQAAALTAQSTGIAGLLESAAGGDPSQGGPGALSNIMNWGLHVGTGGLVPRIPVMPPGYAPMGVPPMTPPPSV